MIKVEQLYFSYAKNHKDVLKNLNFQVGKGEIFGLLGPSGAGKSTIQKILLGLLRDYKGLVRVMNQEISKVNTSYYNNIGVGFELPNLYKELTALENLKTFSVLYKETVDIEELLEKVGLLEHKNKKVSELSKGMKMRLNFCRGLVGNPKIIFLDEPTSGLDPNNTKIIRDLLLKQKELGKTIVITTHNMTFAEQICDRVAFIVEGEIKKIGTPNELKMEYGEKKIEVVNSEFKREFHIENIHKNKEFIETLGKEGLMAIHTKEPSLEEIFTIVTGRVLL